MNNSKIYLVFFISLLWLGHFLVDAMIGIWPVYKTLANLDLAIAGLIGGGCAFIGEGLQVVFGALSDKGHQKALICGGLIATTASAWFVYTDNYTILFFLYFLTCLGSGAFHPSAVSAIAETGSKQGFLIGLFTSGGALGMAFSQVIYAKSHSLLAGKLHWLSIPAFLLVALLFFINFKRHAKPVGNRPAHPFKPAVFIQFFRQREFRLLYICQVCIASMLWGTMFLLPDILRSRGYEPWLSYGWGHLVYILSGAIMMVPAGFLADRYSSRLVILIASITSMLFLYLFLFQPYLNEQTVLFLLFGSGAGLGIINPTAVSLGTRLAPDQKGVVGAFSMGLVWCVSEGLGLGVGGFLATCFTEDAPAKALAVLGCLFIVAITTAYALPKKEEALESLRIEKI
jgi:MFS transporter, FSR family, fosmidomycin resistance protein